MIESLPRREREVFETLCRLETGAVANVRSALSDPISDSAIRTMLSVSYTHLTLPTKA